VYYSTFIAALDNVKYTVLGCSVYYSTFIAALDNVKCDRTVSVFVHCEVTAKEGVAEEINQQ
jgi:hypothetical protein